MFFFGFPGKPIKRRHVTYSDIEDIAIKPNFRLHPSYRPHPHSVICPLYPHPHLDIRPPCTQVALTLTQPYAHCTLTLI